MRTGSYARFLSFECVRSFERKREYWSALIANETLYQPGHTPVKVLSR